MPVIPLATGNLLSLPPKVVTVQVSYPLARQALDHLAQLRDCEAHASVILSPPDSGTYAKLGMHLTCEPTYETNKLYHK